MKLLPSLLIFVLLTSIALIYPDSTFAQCSGSKVKTALGCIDGNPKELVNDILRIALGVAGGVSFLLIIFGGFKLSFSRGDPQAVQDGREVITSAIIGLIIVIFSVFLLRLIGIDILGLPI